MGQYKVATLLDQGIGWVIVEADNEESAEQKARMITATSVEPEDVITWIEEAL